MKKKLSFITAALLLMTAGCGQVNNGADTADETVTTTEAASEEETTAEATTTEVTTAEETTIEETTAEEKGPANELDVFSLLRTGMTEHEVMDIIGKSFMCRYDKSDLGETYEYDYAITSDEVFGTGLKGYMFVEFFTESRTLMCFGYHIGAAGDIEEADYPYSEEELAEGYSKVTSNLAEKYGEVNTPGEFSGEGVISEISWTEGSDQIWAIYGTDLWGEASGVNEIIASRSIER